MIAQTFIFLAVIFTSPAVLAQNCKATEYIPATPLGGKRCASADAMIKCVQGATSQSPVWTPPTKCPIGARCLDQGTRVWCMPSYCPASNGLPFTQLNGKACVSRTTIATCMQNSDTSVRATVWSQTACPQNEVCRPQDGTARCIRITSNPGRRELEEIAAELVSRGIGLALEESLMEEEVDVGLEDRELDEMDQDIP